MDGLFKFVTDDWQKIPQNLRWIIWLGVLLIFNSWLLDHWGVKETYKFWIWDIRSLGYSIGTSLIITTFGLLAIKQFVSFPKVTWYRRKYSIDKINKDFYLVWFNGKLYLFDNKDMTYHHIYPWNTAEDLGFVDLGYKVDADIGQHKAIKIGNNKFIRPSKYHLGSPINTQS